MSQLSGRQKKARQREKKLHLSNFHLNTILQIHQFYQNCQHFGKRNYYIFYVWILLFA